VAKLREYRTDPSKLLLLKCDMGAGHFSVTGRFARLQERALEYAFLLKTTPAGWEGRQEQAGKAAPAPAADVAAGDGI
jgi:oligopeptidase B